MSDDILDELSVSAFAALKEVGDDTSKLIDPFRTIVTIYSAQGLIDNGGFAYFFESDFPGNPPYSFFVDAYRRIQAYEAADAIEKAAKLFPSDSQCPMAERRRILEKKADFFLALSEGVCGDQRIWTSLAEFAARSTANEPT